MRTPFDKTASPFWTRAARPEGVAGGTPAINPALSA